MADTQPQSAPAVPVGDTPTFDNREAALYGGLLKDAQTIEQWQKDEANSFGGFVSTVVKATTDGGTTAWDPIARALSSDRRTLNAKHKASGFDYWTDPNRKQWEAGLSNDELATLHGVADRGYIDVILALDRINRSRDFQGQVARQSGVLGTTGMILGGATDPVSMLAGAGIGAGVRAIGTTRNLSRAAAAAKTALSKPGAAGFALRAGAEGTEQALGAYVTDSLMNSLGEYRSKDDMEMNAISSFIFGAGIRGGVDTYRAVRNRSGGKTRAEVRDAADDAVNRMADTAEKPVDVTQTPKEHAETLLKDMADDATEASRRGRRYQVLDDAEQARLREEYDGVVPRDTDVKPTRPIGEEAITETVTPAAKPEVREVAPEEVDFNQFDTSAWDTKIPVGETPTELPSLDFGQLDKDFVDRVMETHLGDPDAQTKAVQQLIDTGGLSSKEGEAHAAVALKIAEETRAALKQAADEALSGQREVRLFLDDGTDVTVHQAGRTFGEVKEGAAHPALRNPENLREHTHREILEALATHLETAPSVPREVGTLAAASRWLLKHGGDVLDAQKTILDFGGSRGEAFSEGGTITGVRDAANNARPDLMSVPLADVIAKMGTWSQATIAHEIVHATTLRAIAALEDADAFGGLAKFSPEVRAAWSALKGYREALANFQGKQLGAAKLEATNPTKTEGHHYAAKNMQEFTAQVISDVKTQLVLSSMAPRQKFRYFANALDHVFSSLRDVLMGLGVTGRRLTNRSAFTEAAEAVEVLLRANTRDRARVLVEAEQRLKARTAAAGEAAGPYKPADSTAWADRPATPKDDAHVKYMSGGLYPDAAAARTQAPGVSRAPDFDENVPRNAAVMATAEAMAKAVPEAHLVITERLSSPGATTPETLSIGNTHLVGVGRQATQEVAQASVVRAAAQAALRASGVPPERLASLRAELAEHVDGSARNDTDPNAFAPKGAEAAVARVRAVVDAAKSGGHLAADVDLADVLDAALRDAAAAPARREAAALQSVTPYAVTGSVNRLRTALEKQADAFFAKTELAVARTSVALGRFSSFVSDGLVMARSDNKVVRMLSAIVAETTTGGVAVRQATAAVRKSMLRSRLIGADLYSYNTAYSAWKPSGPRQVFDDVFVGARRREFDKSVTLEILRRRAAVDAGLDYKLGPAGDPAVTRAADAIQAIADRAREEQIHANTLGSGALGDSSVGYLPQKLDGQRLLAATDTERRLLQDHLAQHWQNAYPNWDKTFAKQFAQYYMERAVRRARGAAADMVQPEQSGTSGIREALEEMGTDPTADPLAKQLIADSIRGLGHTKGRLDVDLTAKLTQDMQVLDFYVTDPQRLMQNYTDRVSGDIALTEVGILGKSGRDQLLRVLETSADVNQQELAATKRVLSEIAGEPTQGFRNKGLANLRMLTGVARLGGLAWNQLAETVNAAHMLGLDAMLKGLPRLPAMFGEVRRIVNGQRVDNPWLDSFKGIVGEYGTEGHYLHFPSDPPDARLADYAEQSTVVDRLIRGGSHLQAKLSMFRAVHGAQHRWVAEQIVRKAASYLVDAASGDARPNRWLKDMGFTDEMLDAAKAHIPRAVQLDARGNLVGFDLAKLGTYDLQADFAASVHRGVAQIIQGTFAGERAAWMHSDVGLLLGQFRTFTATGLEKQWARTRYVVGEDTHVAAAYGYLVGLVLVQASLGSLLHTARVGLASLGKSEEDREKYLKGRLSPWELTRASMNYSSASGGAGEIMDLLGIVGGTFFDDTMKDLGRYQQSSQTPGRGGGGDVLGAVPALDYLRSAGKAGSGAMEAAAAGLDPDREVDKLGKTLRDASRLLPGSALPPVTILLDQLRRLDELEDE